MAWQLPLNLGAESVKILDEVAHERGVTVSDLVRSGLSAIGIEIPKTWPKPPRKGTVERAAAGKIYVLIKEEGRRALDRAADERHHTKVQLVRMGLEAIGITLPPARRAGNPQWSARRKDG